MPSSPSSLPPFPEAWPYPARPALPALAVRQGLAIPGQGGGWTLEAEGDLTFGSEFTALGGSFGRGGVGRAGSVVIRPYRRGGWIRHVNERTYLDPSRFRRELQVHRALWEGGFPTVRPLGCAWRRCRWGVEGLYLTTFAPGASWPRSWDPSAWPRVAEAIRALVAWGCWSPDLNATNVHLAAAGEPLILDFDRATFVRGGDLAARYRARLLRSLEKLGAPEGIRERLRGGAG